jgi:hypothetical protein
VSNAHPNSADPNNADPNNAHPNAIAYQRAADAFRSRDRLDRLHDEGLLVD